MKKIKENAVRLVVQDDGIGLPQKFAIDKSASLGLKLVHTLVEGQLEGKMNIVRGNGTRFKIMIKSGSPPNRVGKK